VYLSLKLGAAQYTGLENCLVVVELTGSPLAQALPIDVECRS